MYTNHNIPHNYDPRSSRGQAVAHPLQKLNLDLPPAGFAQSRQQGRHYNYV